MNLLLRRRLLSASALASVLSVASFAANAGALPSGGHYVSGKGEIGKAGQSVTVKQSSTTGIIDWNKFSIGNKNTVTFDNGSGATLNRVTGGNLSTIAGNLHATGSLYLMNSSGVVISGTGKVVTGGSFLASTSDPAGDSLNSTDLRKTNASIVNRGKIVASGDVTLVGGNLRSTGSINAAKVDLEGGKKIVISGAIAAKKANGDGGTIIVTSKSIDVTGSAHLSASGEQGGTILIGGDIHGGAIARDNFVNHTVGNAQRTMIGAGAQIDADGSKSAGGNIVIWSDGHTSFAGKIDANGKTAGGFAEVSSHDLLAFTGRVDLTSTHGSTGTLLLDPENVTIESATTANGTLSGGTFTPSGDDSVLSVSDLEAALATANVTVTTGTTGSQAGNITVASAVAWGANTTLTLNAAGNIEIDAPITADENDGLVRFGGSVSLIAGGTIVESGDGSITANEFSGTSVGGATLSGDNNLYSVNFTNTGGGDVVLNGVNSVAAINAGTGNLTLSGFRDYSSSSTYIQINGVIRAGNITLNGSAFSSSAETIITNELSGTISGNLSGPNQIAELGSIGVPAVGDSAPYITDLTLNDTVGLTIAGSIGTGVNGQLSITDSGNIAIQGAIGQPGSSLYRLFLTANGTVTESGAGAISTSSLVVSSVGGMTLNGDNTSQNIAVFNSGSGDVAVNDNANLTIGGFGNTGGGNLTVTTTGSTSDEITVGSQISGNNVVLDSAGAIKNKGAGGITANTLSGSAIGGVSLVGNNDIATVGAFETANNNLSISDVGPLTVTGPIAVGGHTISLTTTGAGNGIAINGTLAGGEVTLDSAGDISESAFGYIDAASLTGSAGGKAILNGTANAITKLDAFTTVGNFALTDDARGGTLDVAGNVRSTTGNVFFTAPNTKIGLNGVVQGDEVDFASVAALSEGSGGAIDATTLIGDASGGVSLNRAANSIFNVGSFTAAGFVLTDDYTSGFVVSGTIDSRDSKISLTSTTGGIGVDGVIDGGTVDLVSAGDINESAHGAIEATTLTGSASGEVALNSVSNDFGTIDGFNSSGATFQAEDDATLDLTGVVAGASPIKIRTIGSGHNLVVKGTLDGGVVSLLSSAGISESSTAEIQAATLEGASAGAVNLASKKNVIKNLGSFSTGGGNMILFDDHILTTDGTVNAGSGVLKLQTVGGHDLALDSEVDAGTVDLVSAAEATESSAGAIETSLLNVTAQTGVQLTSSNNRITKVGTDTTKSGPNKVTL